MAARRRHSVADAEKTARIIFLERPEPRSIPQRAALFHSGNAHKTLHPKSSRPKVVCQVHLFWPLDRQGTELKRVRQRLRIEDRVDSLHIARQIVDRIRTRITARRALAAEVPIRRFGAPVVDERPLRIEDLARRFES